MRHPLLAPDLRELIVEREQSALRDFFEAHHPAAAAEILDDLEPGEVNYILQLLPGRAQAEAFAYLEPEIQDGVAAVMGRRELAALVGYMSHDERADLIARLGVERTEQIMPLLAHAEREDIRRLAAYEDDTAGAVMTSDYATVPADITARAAIDHLRSVAPDRETIYYCYVVDAERRLLGIVSLRDLIIAPAARQVADIMQTEVAFSQVDEDQEEVARKLMEYDLIALPIVDADHRLVGIVTHDDVIDVIVDEATEDVHRLGGVGPLEDSYLRTSFLTMWGKRGFWLGILFVSGFLTASAMANYGAAIKEIPALMIYIPLIIAAGGNCGSQSATLITRSLSLGEVTPADWFRVVWHEVLMGGSLGLALGLGGFLRALFTPVEHLAGVPLAKFSAVVAIGVAVVVVCGNLVGATLPLLLKRLGLDPALMSNPFVASLVDVTGIVAYFTIAELMLR